MKLSKLFDRVSPSVISTHLLKNFITILTFLGVPAILSNLVYSGLIKVKSEVPQGPIVSLIVCNLFENGLTKAMDTDVCTPMIFSFFSALINGLLTPSLESKQFNIFFSVNASKSKALLINRARHNGVTVSTYITRILKSWSLATYV